MKAKDLQTLFLVLGFAFAFFAAILSFQKEEEYQGGIDIAADGGAVGFALLSGFCFLCVTIIQINYKEALKEKLLSPNKYAYVSKLASNAMTDYKNKKFEESIIKLRESISLLPTNATYHYNIACAYAKMNEFDKALIHLEKAIENGYEGFEKIKNEIVFEELRKKDSFYEFVCSGYKLKAS